jgi:hypothetical protein
MRTGLKMLTAALLAGAATAALAGDQAVPKMDSEKFRIGQAPTSVTEGATERPQAVNGSLYAVVAPLYLGLNGDPISYLRLFNGGASAATFTVKIVGSPTGKDYGTATFSIPTAATRQYALFQVLEAAGNVAITAPDTNFSLYIQSAEPLAGYQHVTHKPSVSYFENASVCKATIQDVVLSASNQMVLPSVHSTRLSDAGYPSSVELHNYANAAITYRFYVREETSGALVGQTDFATQANSSYTIPWSQIQSAAGWNPAADQLRANLIVTDPSGAPPAILLGHTIINNTLGVTLNMTTACAVNKPTTSGGGGDGGVGGGGGITY